MVRALDRQNGKGHMPAQGEEKKQRKSLSIS
jgi:hypothetical protein